MSARSKRLAGPLKVVSGTAPTLYTVPAGKVALIKSVRIVNQNATVVGLNVGIGAISNDTLWLVATLAAKSTYIDPDTDPLVLAAGEHIWCGDTSAIGLGDVRVTISGAELAA